MLKDYKEHVKRTDMDAISNDPLFLEWHVRLTTLHIKAFYDQCCKGHGFALDTPLQMGGPLKFRQSL